MSPFSWRVQVYIVMAGDPDHAHVEAVFEDEADAERYATMGDMWVEMWDVTPKGAEPLPQPPPIP